jgi:hypothetical protein
VAIARDLLELGVAEAIVAGAVAAADDLQATALWPCFGGGGATVDTEGAVWLVLESAPRAARRQARVLAVVVDSVQAVTADRHAGSGLPAPADRRRAVVLDAMQHQSVDVLVGSSAWAGVRRQRLAPGVATDEPRGGMALVAAVRMLTDSLADEVLVCSGSPERSFATLLARPDP